MRLGILLGFGAIFCGYLALSAAPLVWIACLAVILAHGGGSTIWVFSTTLLQKYTDDKFRGRVFSADLGLNTLMVSLTSYLAGAFIDRGVPVRLAFDQTQQGTVAQVMTPDALVLKAHSVCRPTSIPTRCCQLAILWAASVRFGGCRLARLSIATAGASLTSDARSQGKDCYSTLWARRISGGWRSGLNKGSDRKSFGRR